MSNKKKILFIGAINHGNNPTGGEEYKNQLLTKYLNEFYHLLVIDTYRWKKNPIIIWAIFRKVFFGGFESIVISASSLSVYRLLSIISLSKHISKKCIYLIIGGYFPTAISSGFFRQKPYENLKYTVVEGELLKEILVKANFIGKVKVLPNFKEFPRNLVIAEKPDLARQTRFLFLSRITPDKGTDLIFEACSLLHEWNIVSFSVAFFGFVDEKYKERFESQLNTKLEYRGVLDIINNPIESYRTLTDFDVMLFPTHWKGEGFPGTLLDSFVAGLPVIATDWNMNRELVENGVNGILIPAKDSRALAEAMLKMINNDQMRIEMSYNASKLADKYHIENIIPSLCELIND